MRLRVGNSLIFGVVVFFVSCALGQLTIDATGPKHECWKDVTGGSGGGVGRKLPLQLAIEVYGTPFNSNGKTLVDFVLTNSGKQDLTVPISPDPGGLGCPDSVRQLALSIASDKRHEARLQIGSDPRNSSVFLYGSQALQWSLATLVPGAFIRVRAEVALPQVSGAEATSTVFVAHAAMEDTRIKDVDGRRLSDSHEVGIATSPEYTPQALLKSSE